MAYYESIVKIGEQLGINITKIKPKRVTPQFHLKLITDTGWSISCIGLTNTIDSSHKLGVILNGYLLPNRDHEVFMSGEAEYLTFAELKEVLEKLSFPKY